MKEKLFNVLILIYTSSFIFLSYQMLSETEDYLKSDFDAEHISSIIIILYYVACSIGLGTIFFNKKRKIASYFALASFLFLSVCPTDFFLHGKPYLFLIK